MIGVTCPPRSRVISMRRKNLSRGGSPRERRAYHGPSRDLARRSEGESGNRLFSRVCSRGRFREGGSRAVEGQRLVTREGHVPQGRGWCGVLPGGGNVRRPSHGNVLGP